MALRSKIADEQTSSLGGWLFADLFLLIMVVGLAGFISKPNEDAPRATTGSAINLTSTGATLTALIDAGSADASVFFRWGTSSKLGDDAPEVAGTPSMVKVGSVGVEAVAQLTQLKPDTTYFFRALARSKAGTSEGVIKSFRTSQEADGPCTDNPQFIREPFTGPPTSGDYRYTKSEARSRLQSDIGKWVAEKGFIEPRVAVAIVWGWSNGKKPLEGQNRAIEFFNSVIKKYAAPYIDDNTALQGIGNPVGLPDYNFEMKLFFVETAAQCE